MPGLGDGPFALPLGVAAKAAIFPTLVQNVLTGTASTSITIAAATSGNCLVMVTNSTGGQVTGPSCTNVTWTSIHSGAVGGGSFYTIWIGKVAGGASGTSITMTKPGSFNSIWAGEITDALTPTLGQNFAGSGSYSAERGIAATTAGHLIIAAGGADNTGGGNEMSLSLPAVGQSFGFVTCLMAYSQGSRVYANLWSGAGELLIAEVT